MYKHSKARVLEPDQLFDCTTSDAAQSTTQGGTDLEREDSLLYPPVHSLGERARLPEPPDSGRKAARGAAFLPQLLAVDQGKRWA